VCILQVNAAKTTLQLKYFVVFVACNEAVTLPELFICDSINLNILNSEGI